MEDKQEELGEQKHLAAQADRRRLEFVEDEARIAQEQGKSMTEDALYASRSKSYYLNAVSGYSSCFGR